jgi:hypothetical protein
MRSARSGRPFAAARIVVTAAGVSVLAACHRSPSQTSAAAAEAAVEGPTDAEAALAPARCKRTDQAFALGAPDGLEDLEIGDAVAYPGGYAVGLVHRTSAGRVGAVALLARDPLKLVRTVDLGPTLGDAPPPRVAWRSPDLVAASYVRAPAIPAQGAHDATGKSAPEAASAPATSPTSAKADAARDVGLYAIAGDSVGAPVLVSQQRDDSLALDFALSGQAGLLVWDEATSAEKGVIKGAAFAKDHAGPSRDVSPPDSDAELPRVVAIGAGFAVVWIARRPEPQASDASESEATGEPRAYGWLEMTLVDERGNPTGAVHRLTQPSGHVSAFDVDVRPADAPAAGKGEGPPTLVVVARDDGEAVDGSGGTLLRVRVKGDAVEAPVAFDTDGLGRGAPSFVSAAPVFATGAGDPDRPAPFALAWVGKDEEARWLPLDRGGSPTARPSGEDDLKDTRSLLFLERSAGEVDSSSVLVAAPSDVAAQLRVFACGAGGASGTSGTSGTK